MPRITKKAIKKHGTFTLTAVGYHWNEGVPYYTVSSAHPTHDPYHVRVTPDGTRTLSCTCDDFVAYRQLLPAREEQCCKHMIGIQHLLDLDIQRQRYEKDIACYRGAIMLLLQQIKELQHDNRYDQHS